MTPVIQYRSSLMTDARAAGKPSKRFPLPPQSPVQFAAYAIDQEFEQLLSSFPPAPKNTIAADPVFVLLDKNAILTSYSSPSRSGAGMGKYNASFHIVPAPWDDFNELDFTFPGFPGLLGTANARDPFTDVVQCRLRYDYFVVDPDGVAEGVKDSAGNDIVRVDTRADIPVINRTFFFVANQPNFITNSIVPVGGKTVGSNTWNETMPNLAAYQVFIDNAAADGWSGAVWDGESIPDPNNVSQIIAADSRTDDYAGNIIQRVTRYVLAK